MADSQFGWTDFRPYDENLWQWIGISFPGTPYLLSSATINSESLERIKTSLDIKGEEVRVLSGSLDRPNVYYQARKLSASLSVR